MFKKDKLMKNNVIFKEGARGTEVYLIKKGEVQVKFLKKVFYFKDL
jgi:hypothetical protein